MANISNNEKIMTGLAVEEEGEKEDVNIEVISAEMEREPVKIVEETIKESNQLLQVICQNCRTNEPMN